MVRPEQQLAVQQKLRRARSVSDFSSASGTYFAKKGTIEEFNFAKGMTVAIFAGVMSVYLAYGLAAGKPVASLAKGPLLAGGRADLWQNLPALVV